MGVHIQLMAQRYSFSLSPNHATPSPLFSKLSASIIIDLLKQLKKFNENSKIRCHFGILGFQEVYWTSPNTIFCDENKTPSLHLLRRRQAQPSFRSHFLYCDCLIRHHSNLFNLPLSQLDESLTAKRTILHFH